MKIDTIQIKMNRFNASQRVSMIRFKFKMIQFRGESIHSFLSRLTQVRELSDTIQILMNQFNSAETCF